jgi:hypothetical protein
MRDSPYDFIRPVQIANVSNDCESIGKLSASYFRLKSVILIYAVCAVQEY